MGILEIQVAMEGFSNCRDFLGNFGQMLTAIGIGAQ